MAQEIAPAPSCDPEQLAIASHLQGGLLVVAPVGSGKTFALTERIAQALAAGFQPERILTLTFTNRAAGELRERLRRRFPAETDRLTVRTFHGLCASILRNEAQACDLPTDFTVCDDSDAADLLADLGHITSKEARELYNEIGEAKSKVDSRSLSLPPRFASIFESLAYGRDAAQRYQQTLLDERKLDFADLVLYTNALLVCDREARERWAGRYDLVQVDELQDTHRSEYRVVYVLARRSGNLALFGDLDQTIYGWRGSAPDAIIERFQQDFGPLTQLSLRYNHRATRRLVLAAASLARSFRRSLSSVEPDPTADEGEPVALHAALSPQSEAAWIAQRIGTVRAAEPALAYNQIAILTRTNWYASALASELDGHNIPTVTLEEFEFFRRQEVKDALAPLRLLLNPSDSGAALRFLERGVQGIGRATLNRLREDGARCGVRLTDLLQADTFIYGEPFSRLAGAFREGRLVVVDVETTGRSARQDDVIEIAALRLVNGRPAESFERLLIPSRPVGESEQIHHISDAQLAAEGSPPREALGEFFSFAGSELLVGHNVAFDLRMLLGQARRLGLEASVAEQADTYQLARRFVPASSYGLGALASELGLPSRERHRAMADVKTTADLLAALMPKVELAAPARQQMVLQAARQYLPVARRLASWRARAETLRPPELLELVLDECDLRARYAEEPRRLRHLDRLVQLFRLRDETALDPILALREILEYAALVRNVDTLDPSDDRVPILTIHQAKGLEFEHVFLAGLHDGHLPQSRSMSAEKIEEERRLLYVGLTRARRGLALSYALRSERGAPQQPSRFLDEIDPALLQQG